MLLSSGSLVPVGSSINSTGVNVLSASPGGVSLLGRFASYGSIYRSQVWVYSLVNKRANALARLPIKTYRRSDDADTSSEDRNHPLARLLRQPNPRHNWTEIATWCQSMADIFGEWIIVKIRNASGEVVELWPMHPSNVTVESSGGRLIYAHLTRAIEWDPADIIHYRRFDPDSLLRGLSPLEPLRLTLLNEDAARRATTSMWRRGARPGFVLKHPKELSDGAGRRIKAQFDDIAAGADNTGATVVLEEGMEPERLDLTAEEAQYIESRKLNREECCAALDTPPPAVHILDHATFSNITEQLRSLYRDTMGPPVGAFDQTMNAQLVRPDFDPEGREGLYVELLMDEVLRGAYEARMEAHQKSVSSGVRTPNEVRKLENLPALPGGDDLLVPLNLRPADSQAPAPKTAEVTPSNLTGTAAIRAIQGRLGARSDLAEVDVERLTGGLAPALAQLTAFAVRDGLDNGHSVAQVQRRLKTLIPEED